MKLVEDHGVVEKDLPVGNIEKSFTIKASAKAFKVLSDSLYTDKILAIIRELSCNALDSHIAAGCPERPFDIQLPNMLENMFIIRDYGTGMSEQEVTHLYSTYFESTKNDSNDFVGALGLGSKSPFCYVDSFTVTSWHGGWKKVYTAFVNEAGFPHIVKMAETESTEENGIEIRVPVKSHDCSNFRDRASDIFTYFPVNPNVTGQVITMTEKPVYTITKDGVFGIVDETVRRNRVRTGARAIMGPVSYPIAYREVVDRWGRAGIGANFNVDDILNLPIDIYFDMGEVEIAASREALSETPSTIEAIRKKCHVIKDCLVKAYTEELNAQPNYWQALIYYNKTVGPSPYDYRRILVSIPYKGRSCHAGVYNETIDLPWANKIVSQDLSEGFYRGSRYNTTWNFYLPKITVDTATKTNVRTVVYEPMQFQYRVNEYDTEIFIADKILTQKELKLFCKKEGRSKAIVIYPQRHFKETSKKYLERIQKEVRPLADDVSKTFGGVKVTFLSDIDVPEEEHKAIVVVKPITKNEVYVFSRFNSSKLYPYPKTQIDLSEGGIYIPFKGGRPLITPAKLSMTVDKARSLKLIDDKTMIYGVSQLNIKEVMDNPKWIHIDKHIAAEIKKELKVTSSHATRYSYYTILNEVFGYQDLSILQKLCALDKKKIKSADMISLLAIVNQMEDNNRTKELVRLSELVGGTLDSPVDREKTTKFVTETWTRYPFLSRLNYFDKSEHDHIIQYINLIGENT
jgi:hypothetical protein